MKTLTTILILVVLLSCSTNEPSKELESKEQTLELFWVGWACDCPQWMKPEDYKLISEELDIDCENDTTCVEIEPAHDSLIIPDMYWKNPCGGKKFRFSGSFYKEKQKHPGNDRTIHAKTFKYKKYEYLPTKFQLRNDSIYLISDLQAYNMIYKLSYVNDYLKQNEHKDYFVWHSGCPNDTSTFYVYELTHIEKDGLTVADEIIRLNAEDGIFELMNKESKEFEKI